MRRPAVRALIAGGILVALLLLWAVSAVVAGRESLFSWALVGAVALPVAYVRRLRPGAAFLVYGSIALALAASPIDVVLRPTGSLSARVLPASFGPFCKSDTACFGCSIGPRPPKRALVLGY
jgi:hypothetical protein